MVLLSDRQRRELEYHRLRAEKMRSLLNEPFSFDVLYNPRKRWWNCYWSMFSFIKSHNIRGKSLLVVGCGFGEDALRLAKLGANISAFDLSPESINIAINLAEKEKMIINFSQQASENIIYDTNSFDWIVAVDIFHHVDIKKTIAELLRVSKPGAYFVASEIYSHSVTNPLRNSWFVKNILYKYVKNIIYDGKKPYITLDERKLTQYDISIIKKMLEPVEIEEYYYFLVRRLISDRYDFINKMDRIFLKTVGPLGRFLGGRVLLAGKIAKLK